MDGCDASLLCACGDETVPRMRTAGKAPFIPEYFMVEKLDTKVN